MNDISGILKKFSKYNLKRASDIPIPRRLPTGVDTLDIITGGGYPSSRIVELYGKESVGKTLLALKAIAVNQKAGLSCAFVDAEKTFDFEWAKKQGVNTEDLVVYRPEYGELSIDFIKELIQSDAMDIIVLDSIEGIVPKQEIEASSEEAQVALKARMMNKAVRVWNSVITSSERQPLVLCINQMRLTMEKYNPTTTPGGMGMKYFTSMRIELTRGKTQKDTKTKDKRYVEIRAKTDKNKVSIPGKYGYWTMYIGYDEAFPPGYCESTNFVVSQAKHIGLVKSAGAWFYYGDKKFQGKQDFVDYIYENPEIYKDFMQKIIKEVRNESEEKKVPNTGEESKEEN